MPSPSADLSRRLALSSSAQSRRPLGRTIGAERASEREPFTTTGPASSQLRFRGLLDDAPLAERADLVGAEAEGAEDLVGMLAAVGSGPDDGARGLGELEGHPELADRAVDRVLDLDHHAPVDDLGVLHHLVDVVDLAHADVGLREQVEPLVARSRADDRLDLAPRRLLLGVRHADE